MPRVTVIMRTKNSDQVVAQALAGLRSQRFSDYKLIVVDSGSTDRTLEIVKQYPCQLIEIEAASYFPGSVLNSAIEKARGEIIVFQNSDVVPLSDRALERLVGAFDDPETHAAFARQTPRPEALPWVRRDYAASFPPEGDAPPWITFSLPFAAMRKSTWDLHPFYEDAWASEDTEWGNWARKSGHKIQYVPDSVVMHSHNYTMRQVYGRRYVEGEADAFIYGRREPLWNVVSRTCRSTARDWWTAAKSCQLSDVVATPMRRLVYHWAYYRGHRLGAARRDAGVRDTSIGQAVVLSRHEP